MWIALILRYKTLPIVGLSTNNGIEATKTEQVWVGQQLEFGIALFFSACIHRPSRILGGWYPGFWMWIRAVLGRQRSKIKKINSPGSKSPENDRIRKKKGSGFPVAKPLAKPGFQPVNKLLYFFSTSRRR
jgi:hypothetical protein